MNVFRDTMRPAVSTGLSVTRVGGVGQNARQKKLSAQLTGLINAYRQAEEFAHFGSELALQAQKDLVRGKQLFELMNQKPDETYTSAQQIMMFDALLDAGEAVVDIKQLKQAVKEIVKDQSKDMDDKTFTALKAEVAKAGYVELKK
jgi:F-type H+-transporting ATPase subunit alpha